MLDPVSRPRLLSQTVRKPWIEKVAMKAKASATPPNWASTPHNEVMNRLSRPSGRAVDTAYARTAPITAPASAVTRDRTTECCRAGRKLEFAPPSAATLSSVGRPDPSANAPTTTTIVGMSRKTVV
jgi:hypothetical protein